MSKYQLSSDLSDTSTPASTAIMPPVSRSSGSGLRGKGRPNVVLVIGGTGVGKSSFVAAASGKEVGVGHALRSFTASCQAVDVALDAKHAIRIVDTPGFNDTTRSDLDVLAAIAGWIQTNKAAIAGIVFMHRINEQRFTGKDRMTFEILKAMCGPHFLSHIVLCTSMWDQLPSGNVREAETRESELVGSEQFWNPLLARGAEYRRYMGDRASALEIIEAVVQHPASSKMEMQLELLDPKCDIEDTAAGRIVTAEIRKKEEKLRRQRMEEEEEERELREKLKEEQESLQHQQEQRKREKEFGVFRKTDGGSSRDQRKSRRSKDMRNVVEIVPSTGNGQNRHERELAAPNDPRASVPQARFGGLKMNLPYFGRSG
ncbi:P-loop containing nucleoside triphosphate hydrolase protein [Phaeosphaeria sp. MPI-PUGE-AT-0046c]|nr:P-loop containing nucleoside triphosphate hydrolase protein [Phaeosphaeria sp. MPI-PUGE-AT-0046c]